MADIIDKVALLYLRNGKILSTLSKGKDKYYFPGGKRENGESDMQCLSREIREELSVEVVTETAKFYGVFEAQAHGKAPGVIVRMTCYTAELTGEPRANSEIAETVWLNFSDIDKVSQVDKIVFDDLRAKKILD